MIAGEHIKRSDVQTKILPCMVCDRPIYLSGYGVDTVDNKVKAKDHQKAIALECLAELISRYGSYLAKRQKSLTPDQVEHLKNLEISNKEYLDELQRMMPIAKEKPRIGYLMCWLNEAGKLDIVETPEGLIAQFKKDMDELAGVLQ